VRQEFQETVRLAAGADEVWRTVGDIPSVLGWISIVEGVAEVEPRLRYGAVLQDRLGPFKLRADLDIVVEERDEPRLIRARAAGEDRQIGSRLIIEVTMTLVAADDGTAVDVSGSYEVTGRPASLGAGSIRKKAGRILDEFFASAERSLADGGSRR
jgi:carbon monoxide dehydrogenase subunit G